MDHPRSSAIVLLVLSTFDRVTGPNGAAYFEYQNWSPGFTELGAWTSGQYHLALRRSCVVRLASCVGTVRMVQPWPDPLERGAYKAILFERLTANVDPALVMEV
jgi:hypothetical protein